ncbi:aldo/keto reductase [Nitrospinota bacterium]
MEYTTLGRTGLRVSVAGLGCGGNSLLGMWRGKGQNHSVSLVKQAVDLGVNFIDTAKNYGTEPIVGATLKEIPRDRVVISTKHVANRGGILIPPGEVVAGLDQSLKSLGVDFIDVFQMHHVPPSVYDHALCEVVPALLRERERGKFRFLGISESAPNDLQHSMLQRAVKDGCWDVMMFAFHMMNQNARSFLFPLTREEKVGTVIMYAVRNLFGVPGWLQKVMGELAREGRVADWLAGTENPLGFLLHEGGAENIIEAAYRYARHEPGADVVLFGTGDPGHLKSNVEAILKPPLPEEDLAKIRDLFGSLEGVGLDLPSRPSRAAG